MSREYNVVAGARVLTIRAVLAKRSLSLRRTYSITFSTEPIYHVATAVV